MKGFIHFCLVCIVIGLVISTVLSLMPALSTMGKTLMISYEQGRHEDAYNMFTKEFRSKTTLAQFEEAMNYNGLDKYKSVEWVREYINPEQTEGYVRGIVTTTDGRKFYIRIVFVMAETDEWLFGKSWQMAVIDFSQPTDEKSRATPAPSQ